MSIRVAGVNIPNKRLEVALAYVHGIGKTAAKEICSNVNISPDKKVEVLGESEVSKLRAYIDKEYTVEGDLRKPVSSLNKLALIPVAAEETYLFKKSETLAKSGNTHLLLSALKFPVQQSLAVVLSGTSTPLGTQH